ncbi:MAG TPA: DNRLRE domain-containing protein [Candidatus Hydrogenedentes bacterium]|nr:DNRLRE domain-containing protein [Candidatus Hydrogenedentota bacterium]
MAIAAMVLYGVAAYAAGGRTHCEMGRRAVNQYIGSDVEPMLPGLPGLFATDDLRCAFYCGCSFPDWGYQGGFPDASEASHWRPFQEAYVAVLRERFPRPWGDEAKQEIAFFLGAIEHGTTDVPWHFSYDDCVSFQDAVRREDGDADECEPALDVHLYATLPLDVNMVGRAFWPTDTILYAFGRCGIAVPRDGLVKGCNLLQLAWNFGDPLGAVAELHYRNRYPWAKAHFIDYYYGGVEHCAAMTSVWIKYFYARLCGWHFYQNTQPSGWPPTDSYRPFLGVHDAHVCKAKPSANTGGEPLIHVGHTGEADERIGLVRVDLDDIPPHTDIEKAMLWLYTARSITPLATPLRVDAFRVEWPWAEGTGLSHPMHGTEGREAEPGDITWRELQDGDVPYDPKGPPLAQAAIHADPRDGYWVSWDVTEAARDWIGNPEANFGVALRAEPADGRADAMCGFYSSQAFTCERAEAGRRYGCRVAWRPTLVIFPAE